MEERRCEHTHIETVVVLEQELELRGKVAQGARHKAEEHGGSCLDG